MVFTAAAMLAAVTAAAQKSDVLRVKEMKLSNGLTVWINEDHTQPKVFGAVVVKAGAKDCPNTGIAHYFEHIMFKGTDKIGTTDYEAEKPWLDSIAVKYDLLAKTADEAQRTAIQKDINRLSQKAGEYAIPNEFYNLISRYGGSNTNAYTSLDETVFHNTFTPQYMAQWAEINSERLISPVFRLFQGELETVYEEKNMYSDNPVMGALDVLQARVFTGTPYAYPVLGSTEMLKNPRLSQMREFYEKYYVAGNMGLMLCGDICADSIMPILESTFGRIRRGEAKATVPFAPKPFQAGDRLQIKVPIPIIKAEGLLYNAPTDRDADHVAFELAVSLLSNSAETGMLDSLVNENRMMTAMAGTLDEFKEQGIAGIGYIPNLPFGSKKKAERMCMEQVEKLKKGMFSDSALEALKTEKLRQTEQDLEDIGIRAAMMINAFSHELPWTDITGRQDRIKAVTKDDIMRVANKYFTDNCLRVTKKFGKYPKDKVSQPGYTPVTPKHSGGTKSEYAKRLEQMPVTELKPKFVDFDKDVTTVKINSLATLYTVANPINDIFDLQLIYHKGTIASPELEAAGQYVKMLGTDSLTKQQLGRAMQSIGAEINVEAYQNRFTITLSGFDSSLQEAMKLLGTFMNSTKVNDKAFKDLVAAAKINDKTFFRDNSNIAQAVYDKVRYGEASEYINRLTTAQLKTMSGAQLIDLFRQVQENELSIVYSGRLDTKSVADAVRKYIPVDKVTKQRTDSYRALQAYAEPTVYIFDNPEARQTIIGTYQQLPATPTNADRTRQMLWGEYFGGGMSSLMFQDIREFRSFAYYASGRCQSSHAALHPNEPTAFVTSMGTQADKTMAALAVLDSLLTDMPMRENNVAASKQAIINAVSNNSPTFRTIGRTVTQWKTNGYSEDPRRAIAAIMPTLTSTDVASYYRKNVKNAPRITLIIGDKKKLNMQEIGKYGRIMELKKEDIYRR